MILALSTFGFSIMRHVSLRLIPLLILMVFVGCDNRTGRVPISGIVTIDGKPVEHGVIRVMPQGDRAATGELGPGGRFTLFTYGENDGAIQGTHPAIVTAIQQVDARTQRWLVPEEYSDPSQSPLQVTINDPTEELNVELTWKGFSRNKPYDVSSGGGE